MPARGLRAGIDVLNQVPESVVAAHPVFVHLAMAIGPRHAHRAAVAQAALVGRVETRRIAVMVAVTIAVVGVTVMIAIVGVAIMMVVVAIAPAALPIDRIRRELARTGIGRPLIDIIILMHRFGAGIFAYRVGQPLIGPAAAAAVATAIDLRRGDVDGRRNIDLR